MGDLISFFPFDSSSLNKMTKDLTFSNEKILEKTDHKPAKGLSEINF